MPLESSQNVFPGDGGAAREAAPGAAAETDVFVIPRVVFNYIVIAVTFLIVGVILGAIIFGRGGAAIDQVTLADIVQKSVIQALDDYTSARQGLNPNQVYDITTSAEDPSLGPTDALVTMVEFSDFRCSYCARFAAETLPLLIKNYGDRVRFVYRDYPQFGALSEQAAMAAQCANDQGKFWEYHNLLFASQQALTTEAIYPQLAQQIGLDMEAFTACYDGQTYREEVAADFADGQKYGRIGTPTFFINGKPLIGAQPYEVFAQALDEQLASMQSGG